MLWSRELKRAQTTNKNLKNLPMKTKNYLLLCLTLSLFTFISNAQYTSCAAAAAGSQLSNGGCLTNQNATVGVPAANCGGGFNSGVGLFYKFTAGTCPQFDLTFNANEDVQFLLWTTGCALVSGTIECSYAQANTPITESYNNPTYGPNLTNGTQYILEICTKTTSNFSICYTANTPEAANNECSGSSGVSPTGATFFNGGNCEYTGSYDDATTSDPAAATFCAGSLENTLWTQFQPVAGTTSIQIIGSSISCGGPVCAWQFGLFSGSCGSLTPEGCISNGNPCATGPDPNSASTNPSGGNGTYLLTWNSISGTGFTGTITMAGGAPFTGTETFYLAMDGNANSDCQFTLAGVNIQQLPIELISFIGKRYANVNRLVWEVASELNNDYFTIERSTDGTIWREIGQIDGAGTSQEQRKYSFIDETFEARTNYYRLKQTDFDGAYEYSKVIYVDNSNTDRFLLRTVNLMGAEVNADYQGIVIDVFSDGSSEKRYQ